MGRDRYKHLLSDADVRRWHNNTARGSHVTAEVYLRRLGAFCETYRTTPKGLLAMGDDELYNLVLDHVSLRENEGYAGSYIIHSTVKAVRSWLGHNRRELKGKVRIRGAQDTPSLKDERVPTKDELKRILLSGDKVEAQPA